MKVCVVGLGYIGLPTALMLASHGVSVCGVDKNESLLKELTAGRVTFEEAGLPELYKNALKAGIEFSNVCVSADVYIVAVATPYDAETKRVDASFVAAAVKDVLSVCPKGAVIVIESTISPGTVDRCVRPLLKEYARDDIRLAHAPERIIPGNMIYELLHNSRTIGADDAETGELVKSIYSSFCGGSIVVTDIRTAEMSKVVENTFRDINIAFANELARICREGGMDVYEIIRIANMHPRVNILQPGPGVGGHCISVDPWFLVGDYPETAKLIRCAREINDGMPDHVLDRIRSIMAENGISDMSRVGLYGLTYKEDVDDTRESPTLQLLSRPGCEKLRVYDPMITEKKIVPGQYADFDAFLNDVDLVVIMTAHSQIRNDPSVLSGKLVLDTRNALGGNVYKL